MRIPSTNLASATPDLLESEKVWSQVSLIWIVSHNSELRHVWNAEDRNASCVACKMRGFFFN
jgi:hypothetical protein